MNDNRPEGIYANRLEVVAKPTVSGTLNKS